MCGSPCGGASQQPRKRHGFRGPKTHQQPQKHEAGAVRAVHGAAATEETPPAWAGPGSPRPQDGRSENAVAHMLTRLWGVTPSSTRTHARLVDTDDGLVLTGGVGEGRRLRAAGSKTW